VLQSKQDSRYRGLRLTRNFGAQAAIVAGLNVARGDAIITMDADLQDPPEVALQMISKWHEGYDVVHGICASRQGEPFLRRAAVYFFYRLLYQLSEPSIPVDAGDFRLLSRRALA